MPPVAVVVDDTAIGDDGFDVAFIVAAAVVVVIV